MLVALVALAVDVRGDAWELGQDVHDILVHRVPVIHLVDALAVPLGEDGILLELEDGQGELGHRVRVGGDGLEDVDEILGEGASLPPFLGNFDRVLIGRHVAGEEQMEDALGDGLFAAGGLGELLLELGDRVAAEPDALHRVQGRGLPDHALDAAGAAVGLGDGHVGDLHLSVFLEDLLDPLAHRDHFRSEFFLQVHETTSLRVLFGDAKI